MGDYVYVAIVQEPMAALDDEGTKVKVFYSPVAAQIWVDKILSQYDNEDDHINWNISKMAIQ